MVTYPVVLTQHEADLVDAIRSIQYGTLENLEIPDGKAAIQKTLSRPMKAMIEEIRGGYREIDLIQIHQAEPSYMEVRTMVRGIQGTKRFKFQ